jgi:hypothetical protein
MMKSLGSFPARACHCGNRRPIEAKTRSITTQEDQQDPSRHGQEAANDKRARQHSSKQHYYRRSSLKSAVKTADHGIAPTTTARKPPRNMSLQQGDMLGLHI